MKTITAFWNSGPFQTNSYLLNFGEGHKVLIDPVPEPNEDDIEQILLTHAHFDHIVNADAWREATGAPLGAIETAKGHMGDSNANVASFFGLELTQKEPDFFVKDGDVLDYGDWHIQVISAPGHSPDCVVYLALEKDEPRFLLTGDVIFRRDIGRCDLKGSSYPAMKDSLRRLLDLGKDWPDDLPIYPGHGPSSTWGEEKAQNPYMQF